VGAYALRTFLLFLGGWLLGLAIASGVTFELTKIREYQVAAWIFILLAIIVMVIFAWSHT
jgi:hypothetical protein